MQEFGIGRLGIDRGSVVMFNDFQDGGPMWTGSGAREVRRPVRFARPFAEPPAVVVGITMWDIDHRSNQRADLMAENIAATGFDLVFRTWGDTSVARVRADWAAFGPLPDPEDWQLY